MKLKLLSLVLISLLSCFGLEVFGQTNRGSISGSVTDPTGAAIPGAKVTVTNSGTNQSILLTTSEGGNFTATLLEPVIYKISVEAAGFKKALIENIKVDTSSVTTANIKLEIGGIETEITIKADDVILNTDSGTVGQTISERNITDIPIGDQSILNLMLTLPNVSGDLISEVPSTGTGILTPGQGLSVGGGRPGGTSFLADGVNNTSSASGRTIASFSPATVQEFNVQTSNYSAEFGQTTGGIVNVTTKSGTNKFHGQISYFKKDPKISAAPFTIAATNRPVSNNKQQDYAFTLGGPIYLPAFGEGGPKLYNGKNRSFFFAAFEPRRVSDFSKVYALLPTSAMRSGNFNGIVQVSSGYTTQAIANQFNQSVTNTGTIYQYMSCSDAACTNLVRNAIPAGTTPFAVFPNNTIPTNMLDPNAQKLLQYLPLPNQDPFLQPNGTLANYVGERNVFSDDNRYSFKLDHQVSGANRLSFRYSFVPISGYRYNYSDSGSDNQVNALIGDKNTSTQYILTDTHIFSASAINEFRAGYSRGNFSRVNPPNWQTESFLEQFGLPNVAGYGVGFFTGFPFRGIGNENIGNLGDQIDEGFQLSDTFTKTTGNMTLKFGADFRLNKLKTAPVGNASGGTYNFSTRQTTSRGTGSNSVEGNAFAGFLLGALESHSYRTTVMPYYYNWASGALFFQDDWKVKPNLTINLGMRYALQLPRWEKYNRQGAFLPDETQSRTLTDVERRAVGTAIGIPTATLLTDAAFSIVPTTTLVPAFGFSGYGGRSKYITPIDYNGWEPRFGFAWVPNFGLVNKLFGEGKLVIRGGYGMSHSSTTGMGGNPSPDFATAAAGTVAFTSQTTANPQGVGQCNTAFALRLSGNGPCPTSLTPDQVIGVIPSDGLIFDSLKYAGNAFIIDKNTKVPRSETWSVTAAWEFLKGNVLELSYTANRGTNLYIPPINVNPTTFANSLAIAANGLDPTGTVNDPLGRRSLTGAAITVPRASLLSNYVGFGQFLTFYDSRGDSMRHAGSAFIRGRLKRDLNYTFSYTWSKSIDTGSDAGSAAVSNIFTSRADGYSRFGLPTSIDRAVSAFDVPHSVSATFIYDLPIGKGKAILGNSNGLVNHLLGGWTISGVTRFLSSYPFAAYVQGNNYLDGSNSSSIRMNINPNLSDWKNPLYNSNCPIGPTCEPFVNPAYFIRPALGELGSGPRTYGNIRAPMRKYLDLTLKKQFAPFKDKGLKFEARVDAINVLNHPNLGWASIGGGTGFTSGRSFGTPTMASLTTAEYNAWATFNGKPQTTTPEGLASFNSVVALVNTYKLGPNKTTSSVLQPNFFSVAVPNGFSTANFNSFDLTTLEGYKLYRLRQNLGTSNFGTLSTNLDQPRKLQWSLKFIF